MGFKLGMEILCITVPFLAAANAEFEESEVHGQAVRFVCLHQVGFRLKQFTEKPPLTKVD